MADRKPQRVSFEQAVALHRAGRVADAEQQYRLLLEREPLHEQALFLLAAVALESQRAGEAASLLERLTQARPASAIYLVNLGEAYRRLDRFEQAASTLAAALALKPDIHQAHFNLGLVTRKLGDLATALQAFERAADLKPDDARIQQELARALVDAGQYRRAIGHFQCASLLEPSAADVLVEHASCLRLAGRLESALLQAERALQAAPTNAAALCEQSAILTELERFDEALASAERALELEPDAPSGHGARATALAEVARLDEAIVACRRVLALEPENRRAHSNLIFLLAFQVGASDSAILEEARRWSARHAPRQRLSAPPNVRDPERKLRVGYVSPNFNAHCQSLFTLPLLAAHDRSKLELFAYSSYARADDVTAQLRAQFEHWHEIEQLDARAAAELIRSHGIDVLVDLTMHMAKSALPVFGYQPAPVQIAWLAYPGTTGLGTMDYRVTDRHLDPPELPDAPYSERSLTLPDSFWLYHPNTTEPPVSALPALANGHVTFGCLNSFWKLNQATLELWGQVLKRVAGSRLLLLAPRGAARAWVLRTMTEAGVDPSRIEMVERRPRPEYLRLYQRIDVCLDTLPYNGHTTSLDAFWMGVPVLTLVGQTVAGRAGLCQARNLDLPQLIAQTPSELLAAAERLVQDLPELSALRASLRGRLEGSALMDAPRFARHLEARYRESWRRWCERPVAPA